jgi:hypothetical protein
LDDFANFINLSLIEREVKILKKVKNYPFIIDFIECYSDEDEYPYILTEFAD